VNQYRPDSDGVRAIASTKEAGVNRTRGQPILPLADLLRVDGDPLANFDLVADPRRNFVVIIKDGKVPKNTLRS
jgi:hypothetical protein